MRELNKYSTVCNGFFLSKAFFNLEARAKKQESRPSTESFLVLGSYSEAVLILNTADYFSNQKSQLQPNAKTQL